MANNPVVNTLTFAGSVASQATIQAQGIAGGLTFLLPNTVPSQGQLMTALAINGNNVFLGWSAAQSLSNIPLSSLSTTGALSGDVIQFNGTNWAVSAFVPGSGTVTSVALTAPASILSVGGSPITGSGTLALTLATQSANTVWAGPPSGGAATPTFRAIVAADLGAGVVSIAAINSKRGNGGFVQLAASGTAGAAGDVVTFDANGNTIDSGILIASLAPLASPSFTGTITHSGDINLTETPVATINGPSGNTLNFANNGGLIQIAGAGGIGIAPNAGQKAAITEARLNGHLWDGTNSAGTSGQVLTSTGSISQWSNTATLQTINGVNAINALGGSGLDISSVGTDLIQINGNSIGIINVSSTGVAINNNTSGASITLPTAGNINIASSSGQVSVTSTGGVSISENSAGGIFIQESGSGGVSIDGGSAGTSIVGDFTVSTGASVFNSGAAQTVATFNCTGGFPVIINGNGGVALQVNGELNVANNQTLLMGTNGHLFMSTSTLNDDGGAAGTSGQVLTTTGGGVHWSNSFNATAITEATGSGVTISGSTPGKGVLVGTGLATDGVVLWDNGGANFFSVSTIGGGISLQTSGAGNIALSTNAVTGTNGNVALGANLHVTSANADVKGTATITASTSVTVPFGRSYASAPTVIVVPTSDPTATGTYWVTSTTADFTITVSISGTISFFYHVIG